jgi:hypothetical protein
MPNASSAISTGPTRSSTARPRELPSTPPPHSMTWSPLTAACRWLVTVGKPMALVFVGLRREFGSSERSPSSRYASRAVLRPRTSHSAQVGRAVTPTSDGNKMGTSVRARTVLAHPAPSRQIPTDQHRWMAEAPYQHRWRPGPFPHNLPVVGSSPTRPTMCDLRWSRFRQTVTSLLQWACGRSSRLPGGALGRQIKIKTVISNGPWFYRRRHPSPNRSDRPEATGLACGHSPAGTPAKWRPSPLAHDEQCQRILRNQAIA